MKKESKKQPETADEYLSQGIDDEESGDRWYSSDLLKSLRFFERAYEGYTKALQLDDSLLDGYYNLSRLLFHVYNKFTKVEQVRMSNLQDLLMFGPHVLLELTQIIDYFEFVMTKFEQSGKKSWDLIYNTLLIHQEFIDESDLNLDQILSICNKSIQYYQIYLDHQITQLKEILVDEAVDEPEDTEDTNDGEIDEIEIITPAVVLETIVSALTLVQSVYESATDKSEIVVINSSLDGFVKFLTTQAKNLADQDFGDKFNDQLQDFTDNLSEIEKLILFINCFNLESVNEVIQVLQNLENSHSTRFEFYLSSNDLLLSIVSEPNWETYSFIAKYFKKGQDLLTNLLNQTSANHESFSSKVSLILKILINRSDIDFQRSKIANEANKQVLQKNVVNLLKNLVTWTNKSGGLRENIIDLLNRAYLRKRATLRLSLLESGNIDGLLKDRSLWTHEIEELKEIYGLSHI